MINESGWTHVSEDYWQFTAPDGTTMVCTKEFKDKISTHPKVIEALEKWKDENENI